MDMEFIKEEPEDSTERWRVKDEDIEEQIGWFSKQFN